MRRIFASLTTVALSCGTVLVLSPAQAAEIDLGDLTILATTDIHAHAADYDYFTGQTYGAKDPSKALGMDHLATAIKAEQAAKGDSLLTVDNGDANQGSSLASYYQLHRGAGTVDPMANVFNMLGYEAGVVGNHEFNYGLDALNQYKTNLNMPLLGANVIDDATGKPALEPYKIIEKTVGGKTVKVGVVGVVTPGIATWDKANVEGKLHFEDAAATASRYATQVKAEGADVVVVLAHTGLDADGAAYDANAKAENVARSVAEQSTDVDVVIGGHSHVTDKVQEYFTNKNGQKVLFSQPGYWARFASEVNIPLTIDDATGKIDVEWSGEEQPTAKALNASDYAADPAILQAIQPYHDETQKWVKTVVAQATEPMSAATSAWEDTPILDFINRVQTDELKRAVAGTENGNLPILAEASPFSRTAVFQKGDVTIADMAGLYTYDNTLYGVKLTGAQVRDYLEWSTRYYKQQEPGAQINDWATVTNEQYPGDTRGIPDYSYDVLSGVKYHVNISQPVGQRIENLTLADGTPLDDDAQVILALNNYRWSGGSGYPHVTGAPIVYNEQKTVRDLMINWAIDHKSIDPTEFFEKNWDVSASAAAALPAPTASASAEPTASAAPTDSVSPSAAPSTSASASETGAMTSSAPVAPSDSAPSDSESPRDAVVAGSNDSENDPDAPMTSEGGLLAHTGTNVVAIVGVALVLLVAGFSIRKAARRAQD